jgi:hypothetical protein
MKTCLLSAVVGFAVCTGVGAAGPPPQSSTLAPATGDVKQWVDRKVAECAPKPQERRFDQTGWLTDIRSALKLAKQHNRPVFLFTHDGRMGRGRC